MKSLALSSLLLLSSLAGCATHVRPVTSFNPPPTEKLSSFTNFELRDVSAPASATSDEPRALAKLKELIDQRIGPVLKEWNKSGKRGKETLVITPEVETLKFVSGGQRFLVGAMAGSSAVIMKLKIIEKSSGRVVAYPEFFSRANALGGGASFGATDNLMLDRIVDRMSQYLTANYSTAVGGVSGSD